MADKKDTTAAPVEEEDVAIPEKKREKVPDVVLSERRAAQLKSLLDTHTKAVEKIHKDYPIPFQLRFQDMTPQQQVWWNQKREVLDKANRDYHYQIRDMVQSHTDETEEVA